MSKVTIEFGPQQISEAIDGLSYKEKLRLIERLERETLSLRWRRVLKDIDSRLKKFPITKTEVAQEIQAYRKEKHAQGRH